MNTITPVAQFLKASDPAMWQVMCIDVDEGTPDDELETFIVIEIKNFAQRNSDVIHLVPPTLPFVRGSLNPDGLWKIAINDRR